MAPGLEAQTATPTGLYTPEERTSPPAFLDLADSSARNTLIEQKRAEHERQRANQRKLFEEQMRILELKQAQEERELLSAELPLSVQHIAVSAPTTPPRVPSVVNGDRRLNGPAANLFAGDSALDPHVLTTSLADKRKSVTYASMTPSPEAPGSSSVIGYGSHNHAAGAKSMPASRRASSGSKDGEDLAGVFHSLALQDHAASHAQAIPTQRRAEGFAGDHTAFGTGFNAGHLLDDELDQEMNNSIKFLPPSSEDEKLTVNKHESYSGRLSASSAALDLAPLSQTPPRSSFIGRGGLETGNKASEWPQFSGPPRTDSARPERQRTATNPGAIGTASGDLGPSKLSAVSASSTPHILQHSPDNSRRPSPPGLAESLSSLHTTATRSVPATPLSTIPGGRSDIGGLIKTPGTPGGEHGQYGQSAHQSGFNTPELPSTLQRMGSTQFDSPITFGSIQQSGDEYGSDYGVNNGLDRFGGYGGFESNGRGSAAGGSTALYHHHGSRYGLGLGGRAIGPDSKMNGLHGPKHKRGDMDREFNRFAGTRLEDLAGDIPSLCKDQHGCRYLQKKLEEGVPDHRDLIFRETFSHFADLMTDPFGNYLCQKLLEYSTDEQRNVICETVAHDLVTISLNMHGTRAVQKMIDFLSTQRQTDPRYDAQIHSIIVALSLHVVTLIKDLNGNHVIQKCLNRLVPEDNQFIYNAVAAHCVEVATHRHGCCVLQRCIDHASDSQRIQLVTEITYNALTLVQDPYGNYVVQYILDLNDNRFSDAVIRQFIGNVCALSVQKFSSNVIEKCIRVAEHNTRKMLIEELLNRNRLEKLLRDSFGNYCVQTALDYAEPGQRMLLVEGIRPILPLIRNTPYGKRIQSKLQREQLEAANSGHYGGYHQAHTALLNLALANNGMGMGGQARHIPQQSLHHASQLADVYNRSSLYGMGQNGGLHQAQSLHTSGLHPGLPHGSIDGYVLQNGAQGLGQSSGGYSGLGGYSSGGAFGTSLGGGINDPYQRTTAFPYTM